MSTEVGGSARAGRTCSALVPYVTTLTGFLVFIASMSIFAGQEFTQGFGTPKPASMSDDRWALPYLSALPVARMTAAMAVSVESPGPGRFHQALVTIQSDHQVINSAPYRLVRHPMYAGSAVAFLGLGLALGTWPGLVLVFVGTLPAMIRRPWVEENALHHRSLRVARQASLCGSTGCGRG